MEELIKHWRDNENGIGSGGQISILNDNIKETLNHLELLLIKIEQIANYENGRECGFLYSIKGKSGKQKNIIFYEHRNSDFISFVFWEEEKVFKEYTHFDDINFNGKFLTKWDVDKSFDYMEIEKATKYMIDFIKKA